jgi:hypothetical protein
MKIKMKHVQNTAIVVYAVSVVSIGVVGTMISVVVNSDRFNGAFIKAMNVFPEPKFRK